MTPSSLFPHGANVFPVRCDLADELCAWDRLRQPLAKASTDEFLAKIGVVTIGQALVELVNERRKEFRPGRFVVYYSFVAKNTVKVLPVVSDGPQLARFDWDEAGLMNRLQRDAAASVGKAPWDFVEVFMDAPASPPEKTLVSPSAVLHDTHLGLATVMACGPALDFARAFRTAEGPR